MINSQFFSPAQLLNYNRINNSDDEENDEMEVEYGSGFLAFRNRHNPNSLFLRERLLKINAEWNTIEFEKLANRKRLTKVKFNLNHELIKLPDPECSEKLEEEASSSSSRESLSLESGEISDWLKTKKMTSRPWNRWATSVLTKYDGIMKVGKELHSTSSTTDILYDPKETKDVEVSTVITPAVASGVEASCKNCVLNNCSSDDGSGNSLKEMIFSENFDSDIQVYKGKDETVRKIPLIQGLSKKKVSDDHYGAVIRAIFNIKSLNALQMLQHPKIIPMVRTQIHKRNLSQELLNKIFNENFVKKIFETMEIETLPLSFASEGIEVESNGNLDELLGSEAEDQGCLEGQASDGQVSDGQGLVGIQALKVWSNSVDTEVTTGQVTNEEPKSENLKNANNNNNNMSSKRVERKKKSPDKLNKSLTVNIRHHIGGSGDTKPVILYPNSMSKVKVIGKVKGSFTPRNYFKTQQTSLPKRIKEIGLNSTEPELNRRYPLFDEEWLERKMKKKNIDRIPSNMSSGNYKNFTNRSKEISNLTSKGSTQTKNEPKVTDEILAKLKLEMTSKINTKIGGDSSKKQSLIKK